MQDGLIIDVRRQLDWPKRFVSDASTLGLWLAWLWLCSPFLTALRNRFDHHVATKLRSAKLPIDLSPSALEHAVLFVAGASVALLVWKRATMGQVQRPRVAAVPDYAADLGLDPAMLARGRASSICTVYHDVRGQIVEIATDGEPG